MCISQVDWFEIDLMLRFTRDPEHVSLQESQVSCDRHICSYLQQAAVRTTLHVIMEAALLL